jgi:ubiquinone/menaquinone biosynthesis C-methylase UbiE
VCRSRVWRKALEERFLPGVLDGIELGDDLLEIGPGPGATTDLLRAKVERLTAIEVDPCAARSLGRRVVGAKVRVVAGDAVQMPFADTSFSSVVSFAMLHHVGSPELQNVLLREVRRVLKPDGFFAGMDAAPGFGMRLLHLGDTYVPVDPGSFVLRLESAGFRKVTVETDRFAFRFRAVAE